MIIYEKDLLISGDTISIIEIIRRETYVFLRKKKKSLFVYWRGFDLFKLKMGYEDYVLRKDKKCKLMIKLNTRSYANHINKIIVGTTFLKKYYTVYDLQNMRIGLSKHK